MPTTMELTLRGVLKAGRWHDEGKAASEEDCRKSIISVLHAFTRRTDFLTCSDYDLIGKAAVLTFLRNAGSRDEAGLKTMTDDDQRNTLIVENHGHTGGTAGLQDMDNQELVKIGLKWAPTAMELTLRGVLTAGKWVDEATVKAASDEDCRKRIISLLWDLTKRTDFQKCTDEELIGKAAILTFFREAGICDEAALKTMTDDDQRNGLIVQDHIHTDLAVMQLQGMNDQRLVELGLEWTVMASSSPYSGDGTLEKPLLFDAPRKTLEPDDSYYVHTSVHLNATREPQFNALKNCRTKNVTVSGVKLIFGPGDAYKKQMAFEGKRVRDLKKLDIYADQVIVRSPLRFPRTDVTIHARELIFEDKGSIDTSPVGFETAAVSPLRGEYGPLDKEGGSPTYRATDGADGEKAGDLRLYVRRILEKSKGQIRLIAKGSKGQNAEEGGLKKYQPRADVPQPPAGKDKNVLPVTCKNVRDYVTDVTVNHSLDTWRWPGEVSSPEQVSMKDNALNGGKVTNGRLILFDDNFFTAHVRRTFLPGKNTKDNNAYIHIVSPGFKIAANRGDLNKYEQDVDSGRVRPGDGEDAYASGKPGNGGAGGRVTVWAPPDMAFEHLCEVDEGPAGDRSKDIDGGAPGTPFPAYWMEMRLVRKESGIWNSTYSPTVALTDVSAKPGQARPGKTGAAGAKGAIERKHSNWSSWVSAEALGAVVEYAREVFRNGHRDKAQNLLDPYYYVLFSEKRDLPAPLLGYFTEIGALRSNVMNNLDYYGNPPGWLPRLDVSANYQIWNSFSKRSSATLYFATKIENDWDKIADEQKTLDEVSDAVKAEGDAAVEQLQLAYQTLKAAKEKLDGVKTQLGQKENEVDRLRLQAASEAKTKAFEQQVFKGVMNIVGGLAQAIPVGQPYLGLAGKTISLGGDIDWNAPDASKQIGTFFTGLSKETSAFLKDNEDLFIERSGAGIPKPAGAKERVLLKQQMDAAKNAAESLDGKVKEHRAGIDAAIASGWADTLKTTSERVRGEVHNLTQEIAILPDGAPKTQKTKDLQELEAFQEELKETAKQKYVDAKAKFYEELTYLEKGIKGIAAEKVRVKEELLAKAETLEKKNEELDRLDEIYAVEKEAAETKTKELLTNLSGLGDGIAKIGRGIVSLTRPYDEKEVDRLTDQILGGSKYAADYQKLLSEVKAINRQKAEAAAAFSYQQQIISTYTDRITSAAVELNAISNQRQIAEGVLDPGMKPYLRGMVNRAKENLLWAQYHFVKAWQYEDLTDVPNDFHNLQQWVGRFREFERKKTGIVDKPLSKLTFDDHKKMANTFLEEEDFEAIGKAVRDAYVTDLVKPILQERQHQPRKTVNTHKCVLTDIQTKRLCEQGHLTFCLTDPNDFSSPVGSRYDVKAKIVDIDLEIFRVDTDDPNLGPYIEFVHSGISVLYDAKEKYYTFQKGSADSPISWGFKYSHSDYLRLLADNSDENDIWNFVDNGPITKDQVEDKENAVITEELGLKQKYSEYRPSLTSPITLWLNRGNHRDATYKDFLAKFKKLHVQFAVKYSNAGAVIPKSAVPGLVARA